MSKHIQWSRIRCLVLSVILVQDAFQAPVKVCIAFMSRNQTTTNSWREITASLLMMGHYCVNLNTLTLNTTLMVTTEASSGSNKQDLESSGKLAASRLWRSSKFESSNAGNFHSEGLNLQIPLVWLNWPQNPLFLLIALFFAEASHNSFSEFIAYSSFLSLWLPRAARHWKAVRWYLNVWSLCPSWWIVL